MTTTLPFRFFPIPNILFKAVSSSGWGWPHARMRKKKEKMKLVTIFCRYLSFLNCFAYTFGQDAFKNGRRSSEEVNNVIAKRLSEDRRKIYLKYFALKSVDSRHFPANQRVNRKQFWLVRCRFPALRAGCVYFPQVMAASCNCLDLLWLVIKSSLNSPFDFPQLHCHCFPTNPHRRQSQGWT